MNQIFGNVAGLRPGRTMFDLSYEKKLTCDMGQLIPVMCDEAVPGDVFEIANQAVIRFQPLVAPVLHEINMYVHYYFVPYRILWDDWEDFISGGVTGDYSVEPPTWEPTSAPAIGSLWDYFGFPTGLLPAGAYPLDFPRRAYNTVYNEYYRDETLIAEVALNNETVLNRCWEKDYFTSSLPWQQRGTAPALPISGTTAAVFKAGSQNSLSGMDFSKISQYGAVDGVSVFAKQALDFNTVDLSSATTFDIADLRLAFQIQKWMERNARSGARYTEFLQAHFGVSPRDDRLQRPSILEGQKLRLLFRRF